MTGKAKNPKEPLAANPLNPPQQMADDGALGEAESFANIEPGEASSFANINPVEE
jgi:hypothetical protein